MRHIKLFEGWLNESVTADQIAEMIHKATTGLGTDEESLVSAIKKIPDSASMVKINKALKAANADPTKEWEYTSIGDVINGELGILDDEYKKQINAHIKSIRAEKYLSSYEAPPPPKDAVIKSIKDRVVKHEGVRSKKYVDSRKIPTIGVGFNLARKDADTILRKVGANPAKIKAGKAELTKQQIDSLLYSELETAKEHAMEVVPNLSSLPLNVQGVLVEMAFNLGKKGLSEFKNFLRHVNKKNYSAASSEMLKSSWAKQVGNRAKTLAQIIKSA